MTFQLLQILTKEKRLEKARMKEDMAVAVEIAAVDPAAVKAMKIQQPLLQRLQQQLLLLQRLQRCHLFHPVVS